MTLPREEPVPFGRPEIGEAEIAEVVATLRSGWLSTGPRVARFEERFADYVGTRHAIALGSCTAALHLSLVAAGVGPGDEVITTPITFCATAHAIVHAGARPVFADVEPDTGNLDPAAVEAALGPRTAAIVPVHLAGRPCRMDRFEALARSRGLLLVEDAAHAVGAAWQGRRAGSIGQAGCFSFYPTKTVTTGEGGMVTTDDADLARAVRLQAHHGLAETTWARTTRPRYRHRRSVLPGFKLNMTDIQAALGIHQLERLDREIARRAEVWNRYDRALASVPVTGPPPPDPGVVHARHLYSVLVEPGRSGRRDRVLDRLLARGVGVGVHYEPVHLHPYYREAHGHREGELPVAERIGAATLSLPLSSALGEEDVDHVVAALGEAVGADVGAGIGGGLTVGGPVPTVGHVNYSYFHSTQSFIYHYLVALRRVRSICLTREPESTAVHNAVPPALEGNLYPYRAGGAGRSALRSAGLLARRLMTRLPPRLAEPGLDLVSRRIAGRVRGDADPDRYLDWAEAVLRSRRVRLLHAYFGPVAWRALELRRRLSVPLVVTFLGDEVAPSVAPWWWWWIRDGEGTPDWPARLRELLAEADLLLAEGPHLRRLLVEHGAAPEKVALQRMALPLGELQPVARRPRRGEKAVVVFVGRFCEQKGILDALAAVKELRDEGRSVELRLIGDETMTDGAYAARVYSYIRAERLGECVRTLGFLNHEECLAEMRAGDVFLHPSVVDAEGRGEGGAPTTILEAQALGLPVVSTLHCDIPYVTRPGESALLVPERDPAALAGALRTLLDDPDRGAEMGRAGRRHVEESHDIASEADRLDRRYLALMA